MLMQTHWSDWPINRIRGTICSSGFLVLALIRKGVVEKITKLFVTIAYVFEAGLAGGFIRLAPVLLALEIRDEKHLDF